MDLFIKPRDVYTRQRVYRFHHSSILDERERKTRLELATLTLSLIHIFHQHFHFIILYLAKIQYLIDKPQHPVRISFGHLHILHANIR